jgi:AcrR family transcriptional regulator
MGKYGRLAMNQQKETRSVSRRARGLQRMASILDAAEVVFVRMGYEEATTNHIAAEAGISPGSLYQFFSNKEEIAQALATRYTEELQEACNTFFSVEATALPLPLWVDQIIDALIVLHSSHPVFCILLNTPISSGVTNMIHMLPQKMQQNFELGLKMRAPTLSEQQRTLSARMTVQIIKGTLLLLFETKKEEKEQLVAELKAIVLRYLEPLFA